MRKISIERFNSLPKNEQRILVAKDIIEQLEAKRYNPNSMGYVNNLKIKGDIRSQFEDIKNCVVCELGACLMSVTRFKNKLTTEDLGSASSRISERAYNLLKSVFPPKQLLMMEYAFEQNTWLNPLTYKKDSKDLYFKEKDDIIEIFSGYKTSRARMIAISENIIRNNGNFKLERQTSKA